MDFGLENPKLQGWVLLPLIAGVRHTRVALLVTCTASAYHRVLLSITNRLRSSPPFHLNTYPYEAKCGPGSEFSLRSSSGKVVQKMPSLEFPCAPESCSHWVQYMALRPPIHQNRALLDKRFLGFLIQKQFLLL